MCRRASDAEYYLMRRFLVAAIVGLAACSRSSPPQPLTFTPPPGFTSAPAPADAVGAWENRATHEKIVQWSRYVPPPKHVPPGQKLGEFVMCGDVDAVIWEATPYRGHVIETRVFEKWDQGNAMFSYTRPSDRALSRAVMFAVTTACPQRKRG